MAAGQGSSGSLRIRVESNPLETRLSELNIKCWPKWGCPPGKYQLKYDAEQTCYIVSGKVRAYYNNSSNRKGSSAEDEAEGRRTGTGDEGEPEFVEFGAGDLVTIPKGLSCTWDVSVAVDKFYKFESSSPS